MIFFFWITIKYIKNQKFSAFDIVELRSKEMWSVSYVTCINIAQVYLTWWWSVFSIFRFADPEIFGKSK